MAISTIINCIKCKYTYTEDFDRGIKKSSSATSFECPKCGHENLIYPKSKNKTIAFIALAIGMAVILNFILITASKGEFDTTAPSVIVLIISFVVSRMIVFKKSKSSTVINESPREETEEEKKQWLEIQNWMQEKGKSKEKIEKD